jgi:hypothetical protein
MPSSALRSASARFNARCTCRQNCRAFRCPCRLEDKLPDLAPYKASAKSGSTNADCLRRRLCCFKTKLPYCAHAHSGPNADRYAAAVNLVVVLKAMGAGPAGRITYAAASRLDGIGRRAIGDMVSSAGCVEFRMARTLLQHPAQHYRLRRVSGQNQHSGWTLCPRDVSDPVCTGLGRREQGCSDYRSITQTRLAPTNFQTIPCIRMAVSFP